MFRRPGVSIGLIVKNSDECSYFAVLRPFNSRWAIGKICSLVFARLSRRVEKSS